MPDVPGWVTLTEGEEVLWDEHPSLLPYVTTLISEILLVLVGLAIIVAGGIGALIGLSLDIQVPVLAISLSTAIALLLIVFGGLGIVSTMITWWSTRYVITTDELYKKTGIVSRNVQNTRIGQVQNTSFDQSWLGRLASYGNVYISTAGTGGTEITFRHATGPSEVVELITRQIDHTRS